ncbi:MAG: aspartate--tRNA ligase, partial [Flavobacteriales bacterium]
LFMVGGLDKYFQLVKCFRDEDLRADRQPEFTQIDCEMAFVEKEDVMHTFESLAKYLFKSVLDIEVSDFPQITYETAIKKYGTDRPDIRFNMEFQELNDLAQNRGFKVFDKAELVVGICAKGCANYSRKQLDQLTDFVQKPQIGANGLVYVKYNQDGTFKSSVDKFFDNETFQSWCERFEAKPGDLLLILAGEKDQTRTALSELRLEMGNRLELRNPNDFQALWVTDFPLLEWNEESGSYHAMHHPFTSPVEEDIELLEKEPGKVRANAYDMVINGVEIGGGSIRNHKKDLQERILKVIGFSNKEAYKRFGFLMNALEHGAPPHGGIAFGFDRWVAVFAGESDIRDFIAFPKNNRGRDVMINAPSALDQQQLNELNISVQSQIT